MTTEEKNPDIVEGTRIAIPVRCLSNPSGLVEWQLIDWTIKEADGQSFPFFVDVAGEEGAWGSDDALRAPQNSDWRFPDGDRCGDEALLATFRRRMLDRKGRWASS